MMLKLRRRCTASATPVPDNAANSTKNGNDGEHGHAVDGKESLLPDGPSSMIVEATTTWYLLSTTDPRERGR